MLTPVSITCYIERFIFLYKRTSSIIPKCSPWRNSIVTANFSTQISSHIVVDLTLAKRGTPRYYEPSQKKGIQPAMKKILLLTTLIITLAIASFLGWNYYQNHKNTNNTTQTKTTNSKTEQTNKKDSTIPTQNTSTDLAEGGKYLVIKEWGVRFLLPEELKGDVIYRLDRTNSDGTESVRFEIGKISNLPKASCGLDDDQKGVGVVLDRSKNAISEESSYYYYKSNIHIRDYWYGLAREKYSEQCVPEEPAQQLVRNTSMQLLDALSELETI
jgi:hypothetical protein